MSINAPINSEKSQINNKTSTSGQWIYKPIHFLLLNRLRALGSFRTLLTGSKCSQTKIFTLFLCLGDFLHFQKSSPDNRFFHWMIIFQTLMFRRRVLIFHPFGLACGVIEHPWSFSIRKSMVNSLTHGRICLPMKKFQKSSKSLPLIVHGFDDK